MQHPLAVGIGACALVALAGCANTASTHRTERSLADRYPALQQVLDGAVSSGRIRGGVAALAVDGRVVWSGRAGEMGPGVPMRDDVIIPLASVGKMYTATAAMILVERGVIALDDPVSRFIPEFADLVVETTDATGAPVRVPASAPLTVRHLLTHTGGLTVNGDAFWAVWNAHADRTTTTEFARALAALPLRAQPGARFEYGPTGASYEVLGAVIEIASGRTLEAFLTAEVFVPLGLNDTGFYMPESKQARLPAFHRRVDGVLQPDRALGQEYPRSTYFFGGGGVEAAPRDVLRFARLFLDDGAVDGVRILAPGTVRMMMADQTGGHAMLWVDPARRLIAFFAFPVSPPGDHDLLEAFRLAVEREMVSPRAGY